MYSSRARARNVCSRLRIHIDDLHFDNIVIVQALAVLEARQRLRHARFKCLHHRVEIDAQLAGELLDLLLARRLLEHLLHLLEQTVPEIGRHLFDRQDGRRRADDVVFVIGRIRPVHLGDIRTDIADIVVNREFLAGLLLLARHEVGDVLGRHVHAVVVRVLQQLPFRVRRRDQMAQIERRQRRIDRQDVAVFLPEALAAAVDVHPVIKLLERGVAVLLDIFARMLA